MHYLQYFRICLVQERLHIGQERLFSSHTLRHFAWKLWLQVVKRSTSTCKQIEQVSSNPVTFPSELSFQLLFCRISIAPISFSPLLNACDDASAGFSLISSSSLHIFLRKLKIIAMVMTVKIGARMIATSKAVPPNEFGQLRRVPSLHSQLTLQVRQTKASG